MIDAEVARHRERFLHSGKTAPGVRDEIASSWMRSTSWSVRPEVVDPPYRSDFNTESRLLRACEPVLDTMRDRLSGLNISFIVSDRTGLIVDRRVEDKHLRRRLDKLRISPGHLFSEDSVGTNGIGTAIELGRATRVDGHEHYLDKYVDFTCIGVPISDPIQEQPVGILDVTAPADPGNSVIELVTEQIGRAIESRLREQHSAHERVLLDHFVHANRRTRGALLVLSDRMLMANPQASRLFSEMDHPLIWDHASRALSTPEPVRGELELGDETVLATSTSAIRDGDKVIGSMMEIRVIAESDGHSPTGRLPGSRSRAATQPGRSRYQPTPSAADATGEYAAVVCGEAGVGKFTRAWSLLCDTIPHTHADPLVCDAGSARIDGTEAWLSRLGELLHARPPGLLIRNVEMVPGDDIQRLVPILRSSMARGTRCVLTRTCRVGDAEVAGLSALGAQTITVPPLRERPGELPKLVATYLGDRRIAPEVLQLFLRLMWPGNITELVAVLRRMMEQSPRQVLGLNDVPVELRRSAPRRPLSRFERAEMHALLDALAETSGNKQHAAALLGISRSTLYRKLQSAGVDLENTVY